MKKIIFSLLFLLCIGTTFSQAPKLRVAVSFDTDTTFTLLGPLSTNSLEINLNNILYKQIEMLVDTTSFSLKLEAFPEELSASENFSMTGIPKKTQLMSWIKKLQTKGGYDLLLIVYKPVQLSGKYAYLTGFSYGLNTTKGLVFSLNGALVYDLKRLDFLAVTSIDSESDYVAGSFVIDKTLPYSHAKNIETPVQMIIKLNQDFALKVFQCLQTSKKKLNIK